jgi:hypothetical protein
MGGLMGIAAAIINVAIVAAVVVVEWGTPTGTSPTGCGTSGRGPSVL